MSAYNHVSPIENFDWSTKTSTVITSNGEKILSKEDYAQEYYDTLTSHWEGKDFKKPSSKTITQGTIVKKSDGYLEVDINWRESAYLDLSKESPEFIEDLNEGDSIEVLLKEVSNKQKSKNYNIVGSYTDGIRKRRFEEIKSSIGANVAYPAKVKTLVYGGYFLDLGGIEVFMPGSQGGMNKLTNFESLLGQDIYVCPINYDSGKNYIVVSHRAFLKTQVPEAAANLVQGETKTGFVTGASKIGIFVEFDTCLTGLIHKSELDPKSFEEFNSRSIKPGDSIEFKIKEVVDAFRIVLTQKEIIEELDPWDDIEKRYKVPSSVTGKIRNITRFGLFVELEPKITGLLHKSEYEGLNIEIEQGDDITVDLYRIDKESKKLFFKL